MNSKKTKEKIEEKLAATSIEEKVTRSFLLMYVAWSYVILMMVLYICKHAVCYVC